MYWRALNDLVRDHVARARHSVLIVAPFIKAATMEHILESVPPTAALTVYTRWRADEIARGVSDTAILDIVEARGGELWLNDRLHAKLFLVDGSGALVGSANVTAAGLGLSARPNLEILLPAQLETALVSAFLDDLAVGRVSATRELAEAVEQQAAGLPHELLPADPEAGEAILSGARFDWLPRFRSPDRLYGLYSDPDWRASVKAGDPAIADLLDLALPPGLDRAAFDAHVRRRLLGLSLVQKIDAAIEAPKRFGALTDLLREAMPALDHQERQALIQLLMRWLLYFAPDRYQLDTPNHSEILSRR